MKFIIIDPKAQQVRALDAPDFSTAKIAAALPTNRVDHGTVRPGLAIVVYDHGMFDPVETTSYFALNRRLYAGSALLYAHDKIGETIDIDESFVPMPIWFDDANAVEAAIAAGLVERPVMAVEGEEFWHWPQPMPDMTEFSRRTTQAMIKQGSVVIDKDTIIRILK